MAPSTARRQRLDPGIFDLPVEKMRAGWYTDAYFNHARATLIEDGRRPHVVMQVFQKNQSWLGGMDEAIAILKLCAHESDGLEIRALYDGDRIEPWETVMTIEGDYTAFAHLETVYLGTLARRTLITTNVVHVLEAANGKPIIFMPARHDHHRVQTGDGYAAFVAGKIVGAEIGVTTDEQASWWGGRGIGTVPHSLIASYGGDTVLAARTFADWASPETNVTVLVDFENDSVRTALEVADALGDRLWGVRLDTSESLVDRSLWTELGDFRPTGRERAARLEGPQRPRRRAATSGCGSSPPAASRRRRSATSRRRACPSTHTASARRSSAARTTSPPTSSSPTASRPGRSGGATARTRGSSSSPELEVDGAGCGPAAEQPLQPALQLEPAPLPAVLAAQQPHDELAPPRVRAPGPALRRAARARGPCSPTRRRARADRAGSA